VAYVTMLPTQTMYARPAAMARKMILFAAMCLTPTSNTPSLIQTFRSKKSPNPLSGKQVMQFLGTLARLLVSRSGLGVCQILGAHRFDCRPS
jgi:hypothetical protein